MVSCLKCKFYISGVECSVLKSIIQVTHTGEKIYPLMKIIKEKEIYADGRLNIPPKSLNLDGQCELFIRRRAIDRLINYIDSLIK